jgi:hypothetical protein
MNMLRIPLVALVALFMALLPTRSTAQANAGEYMTKINTTYSPIRQDMWDYMKSVANNRSARTVEKRRTELLTTITNAKSAIRRMAAWEGDASYRDSCVTFLTLSYNIINQDYARIVDMEAVAEQSYDAMEAYIMVQQEANKKFNRAGENLVQTSRAFAASHKVNLIEADDDKLSKKMQMADSVYKYYNRVYLIMFKAKIEEDYTLKALNASDLAGIEQRNAKLKEFSAEGIKKLAAVPAFGGDASLKEACMELLKFYQQEADSKFPFMLDYILKRDNVSKMGAAIEAKPQNKRTQEEVDAYNKEVEAFNKMVVQYNTMSQEGNNTRNKLLEKWNNTANAFTSKHVPNR